MMNKIIKRIWLLCLLLMMTAAAAAEPMRVVATVSELGELTRILGGDQVRVMVLAKPTEDPHFVDAKPSYIKALNKADLYIQLGMEMETGWAPVLLSNARNPEILPGRSGHLDASVAVTPLEIPSTTVDRSMGDIHATGNPHYLLDPVQGLAVAGLIRDKLIELRPAQRTAVEKRYNDFAKRLCSELVGPELTERYDTEDVVKLARLYEHNKLLPFLESQGQESLLGGWLGAMAPHHGVSAIDDHNIWPYFAHRFGIHIVGHLEPKPGIPPSTKHLRKLVERVRNQDISLLLASVYYDPRHARFIAEKTGVTVLAMANQAGSRKGTEGYLQMIDYNVRQVVNALSPGN